MEEDESILYIVMAVPALFYLSEAWNSTKREENRILHPG
jgi:hypothetical protein